MVQYDSGILAKSMLLSQLNGVSCLEAENITSFLKYLANHVPVSEAWYRLMHQTLWCWSSLFSHILWDFCFQLLAWSSEISRPENKGLSAALNLVEEAKKEIDSYSKGGPIAYADLIQLAGKKCSCNYFIPI